ncbi:fumarate/nitrate reduction transcriptional regulator Fnr [Pigmentiphaga sp.]|jgi:cAMP-binding proteins - catabolite gene activator and regulatory subunit of cAMP-dependent protein kinases|uniref:fumarate/nitrate reduction transcriptional regulator Fnr n=1 Tax=Pigmentiphaga sp. TaxID=1977564 RepID=UPI0025CC3975|nr:fumarate/nitrate reduction transcriptional regulator Fnr [Pigmentiphaga sp.]MBX6317375.1 fumarate/nitrate reduction transcriptional regulator Fnr [Pigmentiphaga sp.]
MNKRIPLTADAVRCSTCGLGQFCLPIGMEPEDASRMDELVQERIRIPKGQALFHTGDTLDAVYGIRFGTLKTFLERADGRQQITGFHLAGEIVGLDGLAGARHASTSVALEDSEVCVIPVRDLSSVAHRLPSLQRQLIRLMSREIECDQQMLLSLGAMRAEERLALFLLNLSERLAARGYSSSVFVLRMSRQEIGNFLGLTLETVSRLFSRFTKAELLRIRRKEIEIVDMEGLRRVAGLPC